MPDDTPYRGYKSYSYLAPAEDYDVFDLDDELGRGPGYEPGLSAPEAERAARLLRDSVVISLHDHPVVFPSDISRCVTTSGRAEHTGSEGCPVRPDRRVRQHDGRHRLRDSKSAGSGMTSSTTSGCACRYRAPGLRQVARTLADIRAAHDSGRLALVLGMEAATPIENEVDRLDMLYGLGVRQIGIAYSESNTLGSGLREPGDGGLTVFGRRAVERMNKLGLAIDVSHSSDRTCLDTFEVSSKPVFITHAGARSVWPTQRMKPDDVLLACARGGGVIGIEAAPHTTLSADHPLHSIESVMDHFTTALTCWESITSPSGRIPCTAITSASMASSPPSWACMP